MANQHLYRSIYDHNLQPQQTPNIFTIPTNDNSCGLSTETISRYLKTINYDDQKIKATNAEDEEPECCSVCLEDLYQKDEATSMLECGHEYHIDCIKEWLQKKNLCPVCSAIALTVKENLDTSSFIVLDINDDVAGHGVVDNGEDGCIHGCDAVFRAICRFILSCILLYLWCQFWRVVLES